MTKSTEISERAGADAMALAHRRLEELFLNLSSRIPVEVRQELQTGLKSIISEIVGQQLTQRAGADDFMSTAEAARMLFVSRPHIVKLVETGKLKLHHKTGNSRFVWTASVLEYRADQQAGVIAYQASAGDEE